MQPAGNGAGAGAAASSVSTATPQAADVGAGAAAASKLSSDDRAAASEASMVGTGDVDDWIGNDNGARQVGGLAGFRVHPMKA